MIKPENQPESGYMHAVRIEEECSISTLEKRLSNYAKYKEQTKPIADYLLELCRYKEAGKIYACGTYLKFREWMNHERMTLKYANYCCKNRLCKACAVRRSAKFLRVLTTKLIARMAEMPFRAFLLTLTVKNGENLPERFEHINEALSGRKKGHEGLMYRRSLHLKYLKQGKSIGAIENTYTELAKAEGLAGVYEIKRGNGSGLWHPHIHMVALLPPDAEIDVEALRAEWFERTGDSFQVDVTEFAFSAYGLQNDPEAVKRDLVEVCTYVLKLASLTPADVVEAADFLHKRRLVKTWGNLRFTKEETEALEDPFDEDLDGPYVDHIFQWDSQTRSYRVADDEEEGEDVTPGQGRNTDTRQGVGQSGAMQDKGKASGCSLPEVRETNPATPQPAGLHRHEDRNAEAAGAVSVGRERKKV